MFRRLLFAVLLGLVTTLLVPRVTRWCARAGLLPSGVPEAAEALGGVISRTIDADMTVTTWSGVAQGDPSAVPSVQSVRDSATDELFSGASPAAVASFFSNLPPTSPSAGYATVEIVEQGFPFRCTHGWTMSFTPGSNGLRARVVSEGFITVPIGRFSYHLTVRPLWEGLLGNVAVYGGVWFFVMWASGARRNRGRLRRRLCTACGYDLRSIEADRPCPECGIRRAPVGANARQVSR